MLLTLWFGVLGASPPLNGAAPKNSPGKSEGNAVWYNVPPDSLAKRRAGKQELTAAHNQLPIGTQVRVTRLKNNKSVVVRVTDNGIPDRRVMIDLCREAA
ncbi:MAG: RlpA-like double-psi beta-barrel domain-containing protein, partial [Chthoniobacterales bacterium]